MHSVYQQLGEFRRAVRLDELIGVFAVRHLCHTHPETAFHQHRNGAQRGVRSGVITVVKQYHVISKAFECTRVFLIEGRPQRCHNVMETCLIYGNHIHITLHEYQLPFP